MCTVFFHAFKKYLYKNRKKIVLIFGKDGKGPMKMQVDDGNLGVEGIYTS